MNAKSSSAPIKATGSFLCLTFVPILELITAASLRGLVPINKIKSVSSIADISELKNGTKAESLFSEAMRKYPPVPFSVRYVMRDTIVDDYKLDGGTYVAIGPLVLHNDERYWDDPETYNPTRFLNS